MPLIDPRLKQILQCPVAKAPLEEDETSGYLLCRESGLAYPVRDGLPIMLPEEALKIADLKSAASLQNPAASGA